MEMLGAGVGVAMPGSAARPDPPVMVQNDFVATCLGAQQGNNWGLEIVGVACSRVPVFPPSRQKTRVQTQKPKCNVDRKPMSEIVDTQNWHD